MGNFIIPDWMPQPAHPPPPDPRVAREEKIANDTRVESELNRFIAFRQDAMFNNPDAFYRTQGEDAIHASPVAIRNLEQLRDDLIDSLANDYQRQRLGAAIDAQMRLTRQQMARHVAEQSLEWQRGVAQDRIALLIKEAAHHHNDADLVDGMSRAAANAARAHARVGDVALGDPTEDAAAATARSSVLGAAIQTRLDRGDTAGAETMLMRFNDDLDPAHAEPLQRQIELNGDAPETGSSDGFVLLPVPGSATIEPGPQSSPDQPPDQSLNLPPAESEPSSKRVPNEQSQEPSGPPAVGKVLAAASLAARPLGLPPGPIPNPIPPAVAQFAARAAASAAAAAGTIAAGSLAFATAMVTPFNSDGDTIELGDGLRARWKPGQKSATIERRADKGLFGGDFGAKWEELPVDATYEAGPSGEPTLSYDRRAVEAALAAPAAAAGDRGVPPNFPPLVGVAPIIYEIRISLSKDGGTTIEHRSVTEEQIGKFCPGYFRYKEIGSRAVKQVRASGLSDPAAIGREAHQLAKAEIERLSQMLLTELGIKELRPEFGLLIGEPVQYRPKGSSVLDVYEANEKEKRVCIYDFKTGNPTLRKEARIRYLREGAAYAVAGYTHFYVMPINISEP